MRFDFFVFCLLSTFIVPLHISTFVCRFIISFQAYLIYDSSYLFKHTLFIHLPILCVHFYIVPAIFAVCIHLHTAPIISAMKSSIINFIATVRVVTNYETENVVDMHILYVPSSIHTFTKKCSNSKRPTVKIPESTKILINLVTYSFSYH